MEACRRQNKYIPFLQACPPVSSQALSKSSSNPGCASGSSCSCCLCLPRQDQQGGALPSGCGKGAVFTGLLLLTGRASYWSQKMQWRKITTLLLILDQGLLKSLCWNHLQQREILFSQFEEWRWLTWMVRIECQGGRDEGCTVLILSFLGLVDHSVEANFMCVCVAASCALSTTSFVLCISCVQPAHTGYTEGNLHPTATVSQEARMLIVLENPYHFCHCLPQLQFPGVCAHSFPSRQTHVVRNSHVSRAALLGVSMSMSLSQGCLRPPGI